MARRLIGTGTTDSNGQVVIEYTGTGAGRVQLTAEAGDLISETYTLYDVLFKDIGTQDDYTAWSYAGNTTINRSESETTITQTDTSSMASMYQTLPVTDGFCVEFDVKSTYTEWFNLVSFRQGSSAKLSLNVSFLCGDSEWHHIILKVNNGTVNVNRDGTDLTPQTLSDTINRVYLQVGTSSTVQYKNFIIY